MTLRIAPLLSLLAVATLAIGPGNALAQRHGSGFSSGEPRSIASAPRGRGDILRTRNGSSSGTSRQAGTTSNALRRGPIAGTRAGTPEARLRDLRQVIARAQRVRSNPSASASARRAAGMRASVAYNAIGDELEQRGDRAGAARAFTNAAASRWGSNDLDMRFKSEAFARAGRLWVDANEPREAADSFRRAGESLDRMSAEEDQLEAATNYLSEASIRADFGHARDYGHALVSAAEAFSRAGAIVTASYQSFTRGAPSTWRENEYVLRARAHDHYTRASQLRTDANRSFRQAGHGWWGARQLTQRPREQLPAARVIEDR